MLKLFGCLLLFLGCTGFGWRRARTYRERPKQLQQLRAAIQALETEIDYAATPLPIAMQRVAARMNGPIASLFDMIGQQLTNTSSSLEQLFQQSLKKLDHQLCLSKEDEEVIRQFAATLGISDRKDQLKHIHLAAQNLKQLEITASENRARLERMWNYLGPLVGALLVILLY